MSRNGMHAVYRHAPRPLAPGACPTCTRVITLTTKGRRRTHVGIDGLTCTGSGVIVGEPLVDVDPDELMEALVPKSPKALDLEDGRLKSSTGACHSCSRQVSGERRYCGPCLAKRGCL